MKYLDISKLSLKKLSEKIFFEKNNLNKMRFAHSVSQIENPMKIRYSRRLVAKLKTAYIAKSVKKNAVK